MIKKNFVIKNNKFKLGFTKIGLLSIFPVTVFVGSINAAIYSQQNNIIKNSNDTISNYNANLDGITNFGSYSPLYYDANTAPTTTADGIVGLSTDKTTLILTSYSGSIIWANDLKNNQVIKDYYLNNFQTSSLDGYSIITFEKYDINENVLVVLFGDSNNANSIVLTIDLKTGNIFNTNNKYAIERIWNYKPNAIFNLSSDKVILIQADGTTAQQAFNKYDIVQINDDGALTLTTKNWTNGITARNSSDIFLGMVSSKKNSNEVFAVFYDTTTSSEKNVNLYLSIKDDNFDTKLKQGSEYFYKDLTWKTENLNPSDIATKHIKHFQIYGDKNSWIDNSTESIKFVMPWHTRSWHDQNAEDNNKGWNKGLRIFEIKTENGLRAPEYWWTRAESGDLTSFTIENDVLYYTARTTTSADSKNYAGIMHFTSDDSVSAKIAYLFDSTDNYDNSKVAIAPLLNQNTGNKIAYVLQYPNGSSDLKLTLNTGEWNKNDNSTTNRNSQDMEFSVINDVDTELKNATDLKNKTADLITTNELIPYLKFRTSNNNNYTTPSSKYTITNQITNVNENEGSLDYSYKISHTPMFDNTSTLSYYVNGTLDTLYKLNNLNFEFVKSENIDSNKWNEINKLKQSKYAREITKENIINYFIQYTIIDKNNTSLTIDESMITLSPSIDQSQLTVTITLPSDRFPSGIDQSKLTYTYTFDGFLNINVWSYNVIDIANDSLKQYYPSDITMSKLIQANLVTLGTGYLTDDQYWNIDAVVNDITGELVINSITYTDPNNDTPVGYDSLIKNQITYTGLKNTVDLFDDKPTINHIIETDNNVLKPTEIWQQYNNAVIANDTNAIKNSLIYKSIDVSSLLVDPLDLKLEVLNLATADNDKKLEYKVTIKDDAELVYTYGESNKRVIFSQEYQEKLIQNKPDSYPFKLSQNIHTKVEAFIDINNKPNVVVDQTNKTIAIDLTTDSLNNINKNIYVDDFVNSFSNYQNDILSIFSYNLYSTNVYISNQDLDNGTITVKVDFTRDASANAGDLNVSYTITLSGFSIKPTLAVNQNEIDSNYMNYLASDNTINIDLSKGSFKSINNKLVITSFVKDINNYQNDLLSLFNYQRYDVKLTIANTNYTSKNVTVFVDFTSNYDSHRYKINLNNFENYDYVGVDSNELNNNPNLSFDPESKTVDVDVSESEFYNISSESNVDDIISNFDAYKDDIIKVFDYSDEYVISSVNPYNSNNNLVVEITYTINDPNSNAPKEIKSYVNITGFKSFNDQINTPSKNNNSKLTNIGLLVVLAIIFLSIILFMIFLIVRSNKNKREMDV